MQTISDPEVLNRVRAENPWWDQGLQGMADFAPFTPRAYFEAFCGLVTETRVRRAVLLMGPRRVGKTVLIHHVIDWLLRRGIHPRAICYLSVDNPLYHGRTLEELLGIFGRASGFDYRSDDCFVFFDEIQYLKNWEVHLKSLVDSYHRVRFVASGSAAAALKLKSDESGAGRFTDFLLPPLTFHENLLLLGREADLFGASPTEGRVQPRDMGHLNDLFMDYLNVGGYPEALLSPAIRSNPGRFIKGDIIDKVLLRDLPSLYGIADIQELNYLFTTLAYNTADEVSLAELSKNSGVAKNTIKKYIEYLEAAFLIRVVHRVDRNARRFRRANFFKVYLTNPSIRSALFAPVTSEDGAMGRLAETAILSQWFHSDLTDMGNLHYARWQKGEVDLVYLDPADAGVVWAAEVKWSDRPVHDPSALRNLLSFAEANKLERCLVTTRTEYRNATIRGVELEFVPASLYCYWVGRNIVQRHARRLPLVVREPPPQQELPI